MPMPPGNAIRVGNDCWACCGSCLWRSPSERANLWYEIPPTKRAPQKRAQRASRSGRKASQTRPKPCGKIRSYVEDGATSGSFTSKRWRRTRRPSSARHRTFTARRAAARVVDGTDEPLQPRRLQESRRCATFHLGLALRLMYGADRQHLFDQRSATSFPSWRRCSRPSRHSTAATKPRLFSPSGSACASA